MESDSPANDDPPALELRLEELAQLKTWEQELAVLGELESDLEVSRISAEVALKSASAKHDFGISPESAAEIAAARGKKRELESTLEAGERNAASKRAGELRSELERLRAGRETLDGWLDAPRTVAAWRRPRVTKTTLGIGCLLVIGAAIAFHAVLLVLLVPLVMAIGYFTFTVQDADWVRLGAARRFQQTGLKPPALWEQGPVTERMAELDQSAAQAARELAELDTAARSETETDDDSAASELGLSVALVEAEDAYAAALRRAGLSPDSVDEKLSRWLDLVDESRRVGDELDEVRAKRKSISRKAEEMRDALFRYLVLNDEAPPEGRADTDSLSAGLERLARRHASR